MSSEGHFIGDMHLRCRVARPDQPGDVFFGGVVLLTPRTRLLGKDKVKIPAKKYKTALTPFSWLGFCWTGGHSSACWGAYLLQATATREKHRGFEPYP